MSAFNDEYENRQIIPRFCTFNCATILGETLPLKVASNPNLFTEKSYLEKQNDWKLLPLKIYAVDFVGTALIVGDFTNQDAIKAANQVLKSKPNKIEQDIAERFLKKTNAPELVRANRQEEFISVISKLKQETRDYPLDATRWVDLAFFYTSFGQNHKAVRSMEIALAIAPENRFVLRSASRLFLHIEEDMRALEVIRNSNLSKVDPWLIAAEISISESLKESSIRKEKGKRLIQSIDHASLSISELAGTMGTLEAHHGANKKAKKLFNLALEIPTENTVAQAIWMQKNTLLNLEIKSLKNDFQFEANANLTFSEGNYKEAFKQSWKWLEFQPFSSKPAAFGSYIASTVLEDYDKAIQIIERGRLASPSDFLLNNNLAFSYACKGNIEKAELALRAISHQQLSETELATSLATKGLIEYRKGNSEIGKVLYLQSIELFKKLKDQRAVSLATYFLAREETRAKSKDGADLYEKALSLAKKVNFKEILNLIPSKFKK